MSDPSGYSFLQLVTTVFQKLFVGTFAGAGWFLIRKSAIWAVVAIASALLYLQAIGTVPGQVTIDSPLKRKFVDEYTKAVIEHKQEVGGLNGGCQNLFYVLSVGSYGAHCGQWAKWTIEWFTKAKAQFPEFASIKVEGREGYTVSAIIRHVFARAIFPRPGKSIILDGWRNPEAPVWDQDLYEREFPPYVGEYVWGAP